MAFSNESKANYIELINQPLDAIPVKNIEDFNVIVIALENIHNPQDGYNVPAEIKSALKTVTEYLYSPELYVQHQADYAEYQEIIRNRINAKIQEIEDMSLVEKQLYISRQKQKMAAASKNHKQMAQHTPPQPDSESHVSLADSWIFWLINSLISSIERFEVAFNTLALLNMAILPAQQQAPDSPIISQQFFFQQAPHELAASPETPSVDGALLINPITSAFSRI